MDPVIFALFFILIASALWIFVLNRRPDGQQARSPAVGRTQTPALHSHRIADKFTTIPQLEDALKKVGMEASQLIIGIDCTKSNMSTGAVSFHGQSLHAVTLNNQPLRNPYMDVIEAIGVTLEKYDDDKLIPTFGFGDLATQNRSVFEFGPGPANRFGQVLDRYRALIPTLQLSGPTSFVPIIKKAVELCKAKNPFEYHILLIICDGQVTDKDETERCIVEASRFPISIVVVGVGDGPFDLMENWDDNLPERAFDNLQFVNYTQLMNDGAGGGRLRLDRFAVAALQEIPEQYAAITRLGLMRRS